EQLGVELRLGTEATAATLPVDGFDEIVVATGPARGPVPFAAAGDVAIFDSWQVLTGDAPSGAHVALVDLGTRAEPAALVKALLARGNTLCWIAPTAT